MPGATLPVFPALQVASCNRLGGVTTGEADTLQLAPAVQLALARSVRHELRVRSRNPSPRMTSNTLASRFAPASRYSSARWATAEELDGVEGIERAYLFGWWAARYSGEAGRPPPDTGLARRMLADAGCARNPHSTAWSTSTAAQPGERGTPGRRA
jgi:hypothetical protein